MDVPGHGEEPGTEPGVGPELVGVGHEPHPGVLEQVLGHVSAARQAGEKAVEAGVERGMDGVERGRVAGAQAIDQGQLRLAIHTVRTYQSAVRDRQSRATCSRVSTLGAPV